MGVDGASGAGSSGASAAEASRTEAEVAAEPTAAPEDIAAAPVDLSLPANVLGLIESLASPPDMLLAGDVVPMNQSLVKDMKYFGIEVQPYTGAPPGTSPVRDLQNQLADRLKSG